MSTTTKLAVAETLDAMSRDERSLLLYLETRAVDHGGLVAPVHMNAADFDITKRWNEAGFLRFSRMLSEYINDTRLARSSHVVELGEMAWRCGGAAFVFVTDG